MFILSSIILTGILGFPYTEDEGPFRGMAIIFPGHEDDETLYMTLEDTVFTRDSVELLFMMGQKGSLQITQKLEVNTYFDFVVKTKLLPFTFEGRVGIDETITTNIEVNLVITFVENTLLGVKDNDMFPPFTIKRGSVIAIWPQGIE